MVALQKADTNLDEVVNDVNNLVNCTHCHGQKTKKKKTKKKQQPTFRHG